MLLPGAHRPRCATSPGNGIFAAAHQIPRTAAAFCLIDEVACATRSWRRKSVNRSWRDTPKDVLAAIVGGAQQFLFLRLPLLQRHPSASSLLPPLNPLTSSRFTPPRFPFATPSPVPARLPFFSFLASAQQAGVPSFFGAPPYKRGSVPSVLTSHGGNHGDRPS